MKKFIFLVAIVLASQFVFGQGAQSKEQTFLQARLHASLQSDSLIVWLDGKSYFLGKTDEFFAYPAYFPTVDSLRNFISRYIRNSAIEAFTNLRLQTALLGLAQYLDSARLTWGRIDTLHAYRSNDSVYFRVNYNGTPVFMYKDSVGTGGGGGALDPVLVAGNTTDEQIVFQKTSGPESYETTIWLPSNYNTVYPGYGKAKHFSQGWARFNGVNASGRPNVVGTIFGYNHNMGGGRHDNAEAALGIRLETHFEVAGNKFELHIPDFIDESGTARRLMSWYINKDGSDRTAPTLQGGGIGFTNWANAGDSWGSFTDEGLISNVQQYGGNHPKFILGSETKWTNPKWNYELTWADSSLVQVGRPATAQADNARINFLDNILIGNSGASNERSLSINGTTTFSSAQNVNPTFYFNSTHASVNDVLRIDYNSTRRLVAGKETIEAYKPLILANAVGQDSYTWMARGTTAERNSSPQSAFLRFNTDSARFEGYDGTNWKGIRWTWDPSGGGGGGGAVTSVFTRTGDVTADANDYAAFYFKNGGNNFGGHATLGTTSAHDIIVVTSGTEIGRWKNSTGKLELITGINVGAATWASAPSEFNHDVAIGNQLKMLNGSSVLQANSGTELKMNVGGFGRVVIAGGTLGYDAGTYLNWGTTYGSSGYGFRDNSGTLEFKNSGGSWTAFGGGMTNPMTTLGDIIYGGSSATPTRLAGNTTTTKKVLTQTGNGSASAAPVWEDAFAEGNYTPTLTSVANVAASTAHNCYWYRIGNKVTVFGTVTIDPTSASTLVQLGISLPVASGFSVTGDLSGTATVGEVQGLSARILADNANNRAEIQYIHTDVSNRTFSFQFSYHLTPP